MAGGMPYAKAIDRADAEERKERRRAGDIASVTKKGKELPSGAEMHERLWKALESGVKVWIINGRMVRSVFDIDFTEGGHDYVYEFVPQNEVWIDDAIVEPERGYVLLHELHERNLMAKGWPYSKAHADSSHVEYHCRHHPDELHDHLAREGWALAFRYFAQAKIAPVLFAIEAGSENQRRVVCLFDIRNRAAFV